MQPNTDFTKHEYYADADFARAYTPELSNDPSLCRSWTGFVILYSGCPVLWSSKLKTELALSTTESEYIALSTSWIGLS